MLKSIFNKNIFSEQEEKNRLNNLSEKELLIEMILELKKIENKCDDIARKIVIWSN
jgi:uncharacterized protein Yka (UPF0111/DUF47 family)